MKIKTQETKSICENISNKRRTFIYVNSFAVFLLLHSIFEKLRAIVECLVLN